MRRSLQILLIGHGSSALRFANILNQLHHQITVFVHRKGLKVNPNFKQVSNLKNIKGKFDAAIISSPTATHLHYLEIMIKNKIPVLVDKPIAHETKNLKQIINLASKNQVYLQVGFNFRYLPIITTIKKYLDENKLGKILSAELYVGQYLPFWRPQKDYTQTYSAHHEQGGGVALDLIHEIDLALFFFPQLKFKVEQAQKLSALKINCEDYVEISSQSPRVLIKLDYLNHRKTRVYQIVGERGSLYCDIINQQLVFTDDKGQEKIIKQAKYFDLMGSYATQLKDFLTKIKEAPQLSDRFLGIDALQIALKARRHYVSK